MRLSEAIMLGDTLKKCDPWTWISKDGLCGCALGGALLATGITPKEFTEQATQIDVRDMSRFAELPCILARWPWLTQLHVATISELYFKVESGMRTLEDIAAYVRSVEPAEQSSTAILDSREAVEVV